jgi:hypothetical protein
MPGFLLHFGATVICTHSGSAQPLSINPRVKVSGQPIVTQASLYAIAGCTLATIPSPPCVTAQWMMAATRVRANGIPVVLHDSQAICTPTLTPLNILVTQLRVRGM